jgi:hypothetical protein
MDMRTEKPNRNLMLQEPIGETRILTVDLRPQRFGFAVFKGPKQLLDWGGSTYSARDRGRSAPIDKRLSPLLTIYAPSVLIVRKVTKAERERYGDLRPMVNVIKEQAADHSAEVEFVGREEIRRTFGRFGKTTKYDIAAQVAAFFPELTWKLPPPRKPWQTENRNMAIFDAASLGITYFSRFGEFGLRFRNGVEGPEEVA